nr:hypothetical protein BdHM001_35410 [Bdellovibrio sp. HM001]
MSIEEIASIKSVLKERKTPKDEKLSPRDEMLVDVAYHLGLRVAELCSLKVSSFVPSENGGTMWVVGKGSKVRGVAVTESLGKRLLSYIRDMGLKSGDPLFISQKGDREPLTTSAIYRVLVGAGVKAKIARPAHPHRFRHSSAAHAVENGAPIDVVKNTLGHSDISSTGQYLNLKPKKSNAHFLPDIE